jgi:hypothetical protein
MQAVEQKRVADQTDLGLVDENILQNPEKCYKINRLIFEHNYMVIRIIF